LDLFSVHYFCIKLGFFWERKERTRNQEPGTRKGDRVEKWKSERERTRNQEPGTRKGDKVEKGKNQEPRARPGTVPDFLSGTDNRQPITVNSHN
jgi:hypothetical protein